MSVETKPAPSSAPKASGPTQYRTSWKSSVTNPSNQGIGSGMDGTSESKSGRSRGFSNRTTRENS